MGDQGEDIAEEEVLIEDVEHHEEEQEGHHVDVQHQEELIDEHVEVDGDHNGEYVQWDEEDIAHEETVGDQSNEELIDVDATDDHDQLRNNSMYMEDGSVSDALNATGDSTENNERVMLLTKDGRYVFTLNLPDLMSRTIDYPNGSKAFLCFSKRCQKQIAFSGFVYTIVGYFNPATWNTWRCVDENCPGELRSSSDYSELRMKTPHSAACKPDDRQVRLRVLIYDLRLMSEFMDLGLDKLYAAYCSKVTEEHPDLMDIFPSFEAIQETLQDHRDKKVYRKRFETQAIIEKQNAYGATTREIVDHARGHYDMSVKFKRTRAFPMSLCMLCNHEFRSLNDMPAHDQLLDHLNYSHGKDVQIQRFTFTSSNLLEQWIRQLTQRTPPYRRLKRLGMSDEHMYYLCQGDERLSKLTHGKPQYNAMHCSAFIRVHDWRSVIQRSSNEIVVDYCLEHALHEDAPPGYQHDHYEEFTPDVFMRDFEARKINTQRILQENTKLQRIPRDVASSSSSGGPRESAHLITPVASRSSGHAQQGGEFTDYEPYTEPTLTAVWVPGSGNGEGGVFGTTRSTQRQRMMRQLHGGNVVAEHGADSLARMKKEVPQPLTQRANFTDKMLYEHVLNFEQQCETLKERMQSCRSVRSAKQYLNRLSALLDDVMADPKCSPTVHPVPPLGSRSSTASGSATQYGRVAAGGGGEADQPSTSLRPHRERYLTPRAAAARDEERQRRMVERSQNAAADSTLVVEQEQQQREEEAGSRKRQYGAAEQDGEVVRPPRQKVFVRRGTNGEMMVIRRTFITKVRKVATAESEAAAAESGEGERPLEQHEGEEEEEQINVEDDLPPKLHPAVNSASPARNRRSPRKPAQADPMIDVEGSDGEELLEEETPSSSEKRSTRASAGRTNGAAVKPGAAPAKATSDTSTTTPRRGRGRPPVNARSAPPARGGRAK